MLSRIPPQNDDLDKYNKVFMCVLYYVYINTYIAKKIKICCLYIKYIL